MTAQEDGERTPPSNAPGLESAAEGACGLLSKVSAHLWSVAMVKENTFSCFSSPLSILMILVLDQDIKLVHAAYRFVPLQSCFQYQICCIYCIFKTFNQPSLLLELSCLQDTEFKNISFPSGTVPISNYLNAELRVKTFFNNFNSFFLKAIIYQYRKLLTFPKIARIFVLVFTLLFCIFKILHKLKI